MTGNKRSRKAAPSPWKATAKPASAKIVISRAAQATRPASAKAQAKSSVKMTVNAMGKVPVKKAAPAVFNDRRVAKRRNADKASDAPVAKQLVDMSPLELRLDGLMREFAAWPHGRKSPPFLSTLLPENLFPTSREVAKDQVREFKRAKERAPLPDLTAAVSMPDGMLPFDRNEASVVGSDGPTPGMMIGDAFSLPLGDAFSMPIGDETFSLPLGDSPLGHSPFPSNPIHPLFPPPGNFRSVPSRYLRPGADADLYAPRSPANSSRSSSISQETLDAISSLFKGGAALLTGGRIARDARDTAASRKNASQLQSSSHASQALHAQFSHASHASQSLASDDSSSSIALAMQRLSERQSEGMSRVQQSEGMSRVQQSEGMSRVQQSEGMSKVQLMNARAVARQSQVVSAASAGLVADNGNQPDTTEVDEMNISPSYVMDAEGDKRFFCSNGQTFANLRDLHAGLLMMKDEHFRHHVSEAKNDFAAWIKGVFGDQVLAAELSQVRSRALTAYKVGQRVRAMKK